MLGRYCLFRYVAYAALLITSLTGRAYAKPAPNSPGDWLFSCPPGKGILRIETFNHNARSEWKNIYGPHDNPNTGHYVAIRVRKVTERTWRPLRTERSFIPPGIIEFNCVPPGAYDIRGEYYLRKQIIGGWLMAIYSMQTAVSEDTIADVKLLTDAKHIRPDMSDHLQEHGTLFAFFAFSFLSTGAAFFLLLKRFRA